MLKLPLVLILCQCFVYVRLKTLSRSLAVLCVNVCAGLVVGVCDTYM